MRVLVTGGSGKLGRAAVAELLVHGHQPVVADRQPPDPAGQDAPFREVDLTDPGQVLSVLYGCDAVLHLGAIPGLGRLPDEQVFFNNTRATYSVLHAAALLGVRRAVIASSLSALGLAWAVHPFLPHYAPVDEDHPLLPQDPYGLSKVVDEQTAAMFHRRTGMAIVALRFHWIVTPEEAREGAAQATADPSHRLVELWGYIDVRDAAAACRLALEADVAGFEVCTIAAADTLLDMPTEEALRRWCPEVPLRRPLPGISGAWSIARAREVLGWTPRHSWRAAD